MFPCRRYPTVERRGRYAKDLKPDSFFPLPEDAVIGAEVVKKCSKVDEHVCNLLKSLKLYLFFDSLLKNEMIVLLSIRNQFTPCVLGNSGLSSV